MDEIIEYMMDSDSEDNNDPDSEFSSENDYDDGDDLPNILLTKKNQS